MKLQFEPNRQYQLDAIGAAVDLFKGQPNNGNAASFSTAVSGSFLSVVANNLILDEETIVKNLQSIQEKAKKNNQQQQISDKLDGMHFSIEMETGTGKTYVYLR